MGLTIVSQGVSSSVVDIAKQQLSFVFPSFNKRPEYINTLGWINKSSSFREANESKKKEYADQALVDFRQSLEIAQSLDVEPNEIKWYKEDLRDAQRELNDILTSHVN